MWQIFLAIVILFEVAADVMSKEWSLNSKTIFFAGGAACYFAANIAWLFSLKDGAGLARGTVIFAVASALLAAAIGLFFYKERIDSLQITGIILGLFSLLLIFWNEIFS